MCDSIRTQDVVERDPAAHLAEALKEVQCSFQTADEVYRRFRLALLAPNLGQGAPQVIEWIPTSKN
jgi:hypothetical protein